MKQKVYGFLTACLLSCLLSTPSSLAESDAATSQVLLTKAVEKLIVDVHQLKLKVAKLENELSELRGKRKSRPAAAFRSKSGSSARCGFEVVRGEVVNSRKSCLIATVRRVTEKGKRFLSVVPEGAPVYLRRWKSYCVYLTLPDYCQAVKEKVKDASVVDISTAVADGANDSRKQ